MDTTTQDIEYLKSLTLLYVEDEDDLREQYVYILSPFVGNLITAANGAEGLEAFNRHQPDIVVTDIRMPVMDGLTMAARIRQMDRYVPIILLTAFDNNNYLLKSINIGIDSYLTKPVDLCQLKEALLKCAHRLMLEKELDQARQEAATANSILSSIIENMTDWVWEVDGKWHYTYCSPNVERTLGYSAAEMLGKTPFDSMPAEEAERVGAFFAEILQNREQIRHLENWNIHKDGRKVLLSTSGVSLLDAVGNLTGYRGVNTDITEEKRLKDSLLASEEKYRVLVESVSEIIVVIQDGVACMVNSTAISVTGYSHQELTTTPFPAFLHPDDRNKVVERHWARLRGEEPIGRHYEFRLITKDARAIWVVNCASVINWEGRPATLSILTDITEQKNLEKTLQDREAKFRLLTENTSDNIWTMDLDGRLTFVSQSIYKIRGFTSAEALAQSLEEVIAPGSLAAVSEKLGEINASVTLGLPVENVRLELELLCKDGSTVWTEVNLNGMYDSDGTFVQLVGVTRDISERKQAENALKKSESRYRSLFDQSGEGIFYMTAEGTLIEVNEAFARMHGYSADEMVGMTLNDLDTPENSKLRHERINQILTGEPQLFEVEHYRRDGSVFPLEVSTKLISIDDERIIQCLHRDISDRKRVEDAKQQTKEAAEAANLAKSEFLANMSHEIRTHMNGIIGMAQLLEFTTLDEEQKEILCDINLSSDNLLALINDILDLSKIESGKIELEQREFTLRTCISDIVKTQISLAHSKNLTVKTEIADGVPDNLIGDQLRLKQILLNLLGNAIKFTSKGGLTLSVSISERHDNRVLLEFRVTDTGIGICPTATQKIFEPFNQADASTTRKYGGTGLGLAICTRLAKLMGGNIRVESTEGVGSSFIVQVPYIVNEVVTEQNELAEAYSVCARWNGLALRILIVDDIESNLMVASLILKKIGHSVVDARNGEEALQKWEQGAFDLILMDIQMPGMSGITVTNAIREREKGSGQHIPIIAMTARALREEQEQIMSQGFDGYISKPIRFGNLIEEMERCLC